MLEDESTGEEGIDDAIRADGGNTAAYPNRECKRVDILGVSTGEEVGWGLRRSFVCGCGGACGEGDEESEQEGKEFIVSHVGPEFGGGRLVGGSCSV